MSGDLSSPDQRSEPSSDAVPLLLRLRRRAPELILLAIILVGAAIRWRGLDRHFFWFDEGLLFDIDKLRRGMRRYVLRIWESTTYNPGWAAVVWLAHKIGGKSLLAARFPSFGAGVLAIGATFSAARSLRLDRTTALMAALLVALSWPQVEYSQQILPYAGIPLLTALVLWCLGRVANVEPGQSPGAIRARYAALGAACAINIVNHNSFIILVPFLAFFVFWLSLRRSLEPPAGSGWWIRLNRACSCGGTAAILCVGCVVLIAVFFYLPKQGEGYRDYLDPYYMPTFRGHIMGYGPFLDADYLRAVPDPNPRLDGAYFVTTRIYDTVAFSANLFSPIYVDRPWGLAAGLFVSLAAVGTVIAVRGRRGPGMQALGLGLVLTLGLIAVLSSRKLFPIGGIRQLLFLTPPIIILTAVGWRAALRRCRWPTVAMSTLCLALYAVRMPIYYAETASRLGERELVEAIRTTGTHIVLAPDFGDLYFVLNYALDKVPQHMLLPVKSSDFRSVVRGKEPFLVVTRAAIERAELLGHGPPGAVLSDELKRAKLQLRDYDFEPLIAHEGGPFRGGQPNPGTYLYWFRPKVSTRVARVAPPAAGAHRPSASATR